MIKEKIPVNMQEAIEIMENVEETDRIKEIKAFINKFSELDPKKAKKMKEDLEKLDIIKIKQTDIAKIIEILPDNAAELNKIVNEANLDADETNKILETIKGNK
jgi:DNA-directed RNA polymerase subunit F